MDELFVNKTISDYDMFYALFSRPQPGLPKTSKVTKVFMAIFIIVCTLFYIGMKLNEGLDSFPWGVLIYVVLFFLALAIRKFLSPSSSAKRAFKQQKDIVNKEVTTIFYEDRFRVYNDITDSVNRLANLEYYWSEDEKYFYLTRDKHNFWILSKSGFEKGTADEFRNYLETNSQFIRENKT